MLFAVVALLTVGNTLVTSVRRRRREFAVMRTIGFVRRQVSASVAWQATIVAVVAAVIGLPTGFALGRIAWTLVTHRLGLRPDAVVPVALVLGVGVLAVVTANAVALVPGLLASRTAPASTLRSE